MFLYSLAKACNTKEKESVHHISTLAHFSFKPERPGACLVALPFHDNRKVSATSAKMVLI